MGPWSLVGGRSPSDPVGPRGRGVRTGNGARAMGGSPWYTPRQGPRTKAMKRRVVVDDALCVRKMICGVAAEAGWEVVGEAGDGAEAVAQYERLRPDLVTMDLVMPVMDGLEALRRIRASNPRAQVVVVTALDQKQALMDSIRDG